VSGFSTVTYRGETIRLSRTSINGGTIQYFNESGVFARQSAITAGASR
jgi:hypothetical protein